MAAEYGNPAHPCAGIERSRELINIIAQNASQQVDRGLANKVEVETMINGLRRGTAQRLGQTCSKVCGPEQRCMLESSGLSDPLLKNAIQTPNDRLELGAKRHFNMLQMLAESSLGLFLG